MEVYKWTKPNGRKLGFGFKRNEAADALAVSETKHALFGL